MGAALYLIGYFHRVAPAVITGELMTEFAIGAAALGNLSAFYFYSYVFVQIPTGALADHWGPRRVLTAGAGVAAIGALLFALAPNYGLAAAGRFLVGASVGVAFVAMLKIAHHWFPPARFAQLSGLALLCGMVGAVGAGAPLRALVTAFGWREVMAALAAVCAMLAAGTWWLVRDDPAEKGYRSYAGQPAGARPGHSLIGGILEALRYRNVWLIFIVASGATAPMLAFVGLWAVPFLVAHYGMTTTRAALLTSATLIGWAVGGPLAGWISDRYRRRKIPYYAGASIASAAWAVLFLVPELPLAAVVALFLAAGVASGCVIIGFAWTKESAPSALAGTSTGIANTGNMLGGLLMQPLIGWMLDRNWTGTVAGGARVYDFGAYRAGLGLLLGWLALSLVVLAFTRETHCRQQS